MNVQAAGPALSALLLLLLLLLLPLPLPPVLQCTNSAPLLQPSLSCLVICFTLYFSCKNLMLQFFLVKRILMKWENLKRLIKKLSPTFVIKNPSLCFRMSLLLKSQKILEKLTDLTCKVVTIYSCQLYLNNSFSGF